MTPALREACARAVHVVKRDGAILRAGRACIFILQHCGWGAFARFLTYPPMIWFVELGYFIVARNRKFFSKLMFRDRTLRE